LSINRWVLRFQSQLIYYMPREGLIALPVSINPYLPIINYYLQPHRLEEAFLLPFDELYSASDKIIFYTYLKQAKYNIGKCSVKLYTVPEDAEDPEYAVPVAAKDMEIRFIGERAKLEPVIKSKTFQADDPIFVEEALSWTKMLNIAKQLSNYALKTNELTKKYGFNLNAYLHLKGSNMCPREIREYEDILKIISQYDEAIIELSSNICRD